MQMKAIFLLSGAILAATGLLIGLGHAARAVGMGVDYDHQQHPAKISPDPDQVAVRHPIVSTDQFTPDSFREDLLK